GVADRPLWNTETGWYVVRPRLAADGKQLAGALSEADAAASVARAFVLARAAGVSRFYWYSWDNDDTGFADREGHVRAPGRALAEVQAWLVGAQLDGCRRAADGVWSCGLRRDGHAQWIVWTPRGRVEMRLPRRWRIASRRDLSGHVRPVPADALSIEIGSVPQLLESAE
ncbi:MAG TPA: hypothetical protein VFT22_30125, partial [Kofleriaceae bacterium]|nr:hypothetical protein [Kofleriaceae bacterium]